MVMVIEQAYLVSLRFALLRFADIAFFFSPNNLKVSGNPERSKSIGAIFPTAFVHFVCQFHVLVTSSISYFITVIFVMVICDQWSPVLQLSLFWGATNYAHIRRHWT